MSARQVVVTRASHLLNAGQMWHLVREKLVAGRAMPVDTVSGVPGTGGLRGVQLRAMSWHR